MFLYHLFIRWGILPGQFYDMQIGEKILIRAFVEKALKRRKEVEAWPVTLV